MKKKDSRRKQSAPTSREEGPTLARKSILDVEISGLDEEGYGISCSETHALRIAGGMPGDKVRVGIDHVAQRIAFGHIKKILEVSPVRSKRPPCTKNALCLGCPLISMKYRFQTEWKQNHIALQLRQYRELEGITLHPLLSPLRLIHYRTTARLVIAGKHSEPYIGIFRRSSHDVFDLTDCPIHHPLVNRVVEVVRKGITKLKVPVYNPRSKMGLLRYLVVRVSEHENKAMVVFVTAERSFNEIHHLGKFVRAELPEVEVVAQNVNSSEGNVIMGPTDHFLTPKHHLTERIGNVALMISPRSFFQVNRDGARLIYDKVREWSCLTGRETVLDLYCGIGGIALSLASDAAKVIGIEVVDAAVADAQKNARLNGISNCTFEAGDAGDLLEDIASDGEDVDVVVLNPPRKGCDELVLRRVTALKPGILIYVSCSPQTLARDISLLKILGYTCKELQPVDMFPQTMHVETVARFEQTDKTT
ncbi:23S rRNA (uracil(1939)-C(5))-methyltransferase RlmD [Pelotalea chapellei]|uniref:23S rRNA (Uracil(1939)-C(5))-methyltransferase RlmD n=1 Tax=Pelotalea chapellei TaxID=44671 RepID=A0ABS5U3Y5_9BACT|nr:23S rRNA (uracil(1939)-C(5))-methyltransferase RlmD [Pelotalea chapellei]MBT1070373.1 23S rRNA (uracil(1939)-C(5))-methyltransferase RlmD [Pelotalea chapellei]